MSTGRLSQAQLGEYVDMAYNKSPYYQSNYADRLEKLYGAKDLGALFNGGLKTTVPWAGATRLKNKMPYDVTLVHQTIARNSPEDVAEFDPKYLHGTQPWITSGGVSHYLEHGQHNQLFADQHDVGNQYPFVYIHSGTGQMRLLGGHHRAASALLKGTPLVARYAIGEY